MNQKVGKKAGRKRKYLRNKLSKFLEGFVEHSEDRAREYGVPVVKTNKRHVNHMPVYGKRNKKNRVGV